MPLRSGRLKASSAPKRTVVTTEPVKVHFHRRIRLPNSTNRTPPNTSPIFGGKESAIPVLISVAPPQYTLLNGQYTKIKHRRYVHHCRPNHVYDVVEHGFSLSRISSGVHRSWTIPTKTTKNGAVISRPLLFVNTFRGHSGYRTLNLCSAWFSQAPKTTIRTRPVTSGATTRTFDEGIVMVSKHPTRVLHDLLDLNRVQARSR